MKTHSFQSDTALTTKIPIKMRLPKVDKQFTCHIHNRCMFPGKPWKASFLNKLGFHKTFVKKKVYNVLTSVCLFGGHLILKMFWNMLSFSRPFTRISEFWINYNCLPIANETSDYIIICYHVIYLVLEYGEQLFL